MIDNLLEDHALVAGILWQVRELLTAGRARSGPDALVRELDGLIAILESHFSYEERRIAKALDSLGPGAWTAEVFAPGPVTRTACYPEVHLPAPQTGVPESPPTNLRTHPLNRRPYRRCGPSAPPG